MLVHASCVVIDGKAVLLAGPPGIGKSDVALRLIDEGAQLLSDDQTLLGDEAGHLVASPPPSIEGFLEIRHVGLARLSFVKSAPVALYVELASSNENLERLPEPDFISFLNHQVPRLKLPSFAASTPAKIRAALRYSYRPS